jgi:cell division protein FtsW (lipid II flippase)
MKKLFLLLAIIGFIAPTIIVIMESIDTGNVLLYTNPLATMEAMFTNRISTIFMIDLLFVVLVFFIWSYYEAKKHRIKRLGLVWLVTLLFGLAGGFPLFLYLKEKAVSNKL